MRRFCRSWEREGGIEDAVDEDTEGVGICDGWMMPVDMFVNLEYECRLRNALL